MSPWADEPDGPTSPMDWQGWHGEYADPGSALSSRLAVVRSHVSRVLDRTAPEPLRVVSACAGDGRDLLGVLAGRTDTARVTARLVEHDPTLAEHAREAATGVAARIEVVTGDAASAEVYLGAVPAGLVLLCGVFGNVSDADLRRTVAASPSLCAPGAEVIWTRHRREQDLTPAIRDWFGDIGFEEVAFESPGPGEWSVGVYRLVAEPAPLVAGDHWFTFRR